MTEEPNGKGTQKGEQVLHFSIKKRKEQFMPSLYTGMSSVPPPKIFWLPLGLGIILASQIPTVIYYLWISQSAHSLGEATSSLIALLALLGGLPTWWLLVVKPRRATILRGSLVGMLSSVFVHVVVSVLVTLSTVSQWGTVTIKTFVAFPMLLFSYIILGLMLVGWLTIPIGAITGGLLIYLQRVLTYYWQKWDRHLRNSRTKNDAKEV